MPRTFTFLGTGTSVGVPMLGCDCSTCTSKNPKNNRYRCSALVTTPKGRILIDTTPEVRLQLLRERVPFVHAVLFTHYHADHLFGLDDVRLFPKMLGGPLPIYCTTEVEEKIRQSFAYAFTAEAEIMPAGFVPRVKFETIDERPFRIVDEEVVPIPLVHNCFNVFGFRFGDIAYCTDVNRLPERSWPLLEGLRILVLDALRFKPHPAHFSLQEALQVIERVQPQKAYLTHMSHELEHEETNRRLPAGVELAYDGLRFDF